jgi:hypothetical protein
MIARTGMYLWEENELDRERQDERAEGEGRELQDGNFRLQVGDVLFGGELLPDGDGSGCLSPPRRQLRGVRRRPR